jgi:membrane-associated protease RseP (regulator of RpoE activity)
MINLMPIGQLDGGHIAKSALGEATRSGRRVCTRAADHRLHRSARDVRQCAAV